ncbi:hypothetical protein V499_05944 [Pseudogymnoascus sp. VKM F-103]|uniref:Electron carrier n=1 Tax=Pseudogymnoascus verrucosus TaxID=342668 RepID=A0A1B8GE60_9PEZI|nr:electron carrier [Pseudogymnoascus verrucosus]KFY73996.1 hypothetical protein V499_05944 [Pseudogymnoascus sp. VKM F-103]OBT94122.1 electron carrier [Pseudogymnoascus verrucosus]
MAPSFVTIDNTPDFDFTPQPQPTKKAVDSTTRTLLIAPPSIASHEEKLHGVLAIHDRSVTDLQMLDRISAGLARLPLATYDLIIILTDVDGTRIESGKLLSRDVYSSLVQSLKAGGKLQSQDGTFGQTTTSGEYTEAILAGLVANSAGGMMKPDYSASEAVPLRFGRNKKKDAVSDAGPPATIVTLKRKSVEITPSQAKPNGVGFVDFSDDFGEEITGEDEDDDDLIDEDTLLTEEDLNGMIVIPPECVPRVGKRRRACKDCSCGLAEKISAEDEAKRTSADDKLKALKLDSSDLAEVDFTVQGTVGSCGSCSLGDAFRCDGCPYIGMPAFKPGEEVRLLNNDVQL